MNGARILPLGQLVIKNKNDSQIRYRFLFLPIFFFPIAGLGQKLF